MKQKSQGYATLPWLPTSAPISQFPKWNSRLTMKWAIKFNLSTETDLETRRIGRLCGLMDHFPQISSRLFIPVQLFKMVCQTPLNIVIRKVS